MGMSRRVPLLLRLGLLQLLASVVAGCLLLVANGVLVASLYHSRSAHLPEFWRNPRVAQAVLFSAPIGLLVIEWLAYDILLDWLRPMRHEREGGKPSEVNGPQ
jgi:hypothetical protein